MLFVRNPFLLYSLSFILIIFAYQLGWADLLPKLTVDLYIFILITIVISLFGAFIIAKLRPLTVDKKKLTGHSFKIIIILYIGYGLEFIHFGGIPLIFLINKQYAKFMHFGGIPTFHVILVSFTTFYAIHLFHIFLTQKSARGLFQFILALFPSILMINRGLFFIIASGAFFVFILSRKKISFLTLFSSVSLVLLLLYFFGLAGNYRTTNSNSSKFILGLAHANTSFVESKIPKEFMWSYLYITSPTGNLQNSINTVEPKNNFIEFFLTNLCPDFISKRIVSLFEYKIEPAPLIHPWLTVGTMYHKSYNDFGWAGMSIVFIAQFLLIFVILLLISRKGSYYLTAVAIINTIVMLNLFSNVLVFSAISFQIIWLILFELYEKYKLRYKHNAV